MTATQTNLMQCAAYGLSTDRLTPHPFNLCNNAGSIHTSISQIHSLLYIVAKCHFFHLMYISPFHQKCNLRPTSSHPSIYNGLYAKVQNVLDCADFLFYMIYVNSLSGWDASENVWIWNVKLCFKMLLIFVISFLKQINRYWWKGNTLGTISHY